MEATYHSFKVHRIVMLCNRNFKEELLNTCTVFITQLPAVKLTSSPNKHYFLPWNRWLLLVLFVLLATLPLGLLERCKRVCKRLPNRPMSE